MKNIRFITKGISLFFLLVFFSIQANGQSWGGIQSIQPIPTFPNNAEELHFIIDAHFIQTPCWIMESEVDISEFHVLTRICYHVGNAHGPCYPRDTVTIGQLPAGDFEFVFQAFRYTIADGCFEQEVSTDTMHLTVEPYTTSEVPVEEAGINLHPNPFSDHFTIQVEPNTLHRPVSLRLYNYSGREVLNMEMENGTTQRVSTAHLPTGIYLYRIELESGQEVNGKIVKY